MFNPNFKFVTTSDQAADLINRPHEDYPLRVELTKWIIAYVGEFLKSYPIVSENTVRAIHGEVMFDLQSRGNYRQCNVRVGNDVPPEFYLVPQLMQKILPITFNIGADLLYLQSWYIVFQTIHPFEDGN